ncbi:alkaline phosphatase D family protein [Actinocorallia sp. API 0066]|uniref:alkaline phosphatase D family protein n=1 Tax=Actinocorallia sp. API 0066 TaxID=2896846 RepID=UPI001E3B339E|nr:alkaline phosphatase D family protein [Actinocorallia sp. API 0066]MCD0448957.1 alkaline phosphatase D family protein [Actinocorallia sp. API 0066]
MAFTRRHVLAAGGLAVLGAAPASASPALLRGGAADGPDPFRLGVASGDPDAGSVVLWTRLAPRPLAPDGLGGLGSRAVAVEWQVAEDARFRRVVRSGTVTARASGGFAVHVTATGLRPGCEYFYRFRASGHLSPVGRTLTAPAPGSLTPMTFAAASCAHYEHGYFTAYRRLAELGPDLVVHLGDYMYEYAPGSYSGANGKVRTHTEGKCQTLTDYRRRHAQYKSDPDLQTAHAAAPWAVVWDDHELEDNWTGSVPGSSVPGFTARKRASMRAYYENMPLRVAARPSGTRMRLYRRLPWGALATFHLLDTRQYRTDQPCDDWLRTGCSARNDPSGRVLGAAQLSWLAGSLRASGARWDVLGQQIFLAQRDMALGPALKVGMDSWDGYTADRDRLFTTLLDSGARNPVVLTGDVHTAFAADLLRDFADPSSARVGVELVTTSIASDGDGYRDHAMMAALRAENPHFAHADQRRGFLLGRLTPEALTADFHTLERVSRRGAPAPRTIRLTVPDLSRTLSR